MMSSKEMEQFMSREEAKMRKWMCREMFCEQMAVQSERYMNECTGRDRESIEKNIYYRHCYAYFKEWQEKAHAKKEQWYERMIQARSEQEDRAEEVEHGTGELCRGWAGTSYGRGNEGGLC